MYFIKRNSWWPRYFRFKVYGFQLCHCIHTLWLKIPDSLDESFIMNEANPLWKEIRTRFVDSSWGNSVWILMSTTFSARHQNRLFQVSVINIDVVLYVEVQGELKFIACCVLRMLLELNDCRWKLIDTNTQKRINWECAVCLKVLQSFGAL